MALGGMVKLSGAVTRPAEFNHTPRECAVAPLYGWLYSSLAMFNLYQEIVGNKT